MEKLLILIPTREYVSLFYAFVLVDIYHPFVSVGYMMQGIYFKQNSFTDYTIIHVKRVNLIKVQRVKSKKQRVSIKDFEFIWDLIFRD